uniref:Uncharacterized protein n=1 Tax=Tetranychus urticae TaxID=32264 RepID=T1K496_TETUR
MWFSGSVAEAVDKSKKEKKLFLVFIEGNLDEILSVMQRKNTGVNLEVIPGFLTEQEFMDKLDKVSLFMNWLLDTFW